MALTCCLKLSECQHQENYRLRMKLFYFPKISLTMKTLQYYYATVILFYTIY